MCLTFKNSGKIPLDCDFFESQLYNRMNLFLSHDLAHGGLQTRYIEVVHVVIWKDMTAEAAVHG